MHSSYYSGCARVCVCVPTILSGSDVVVAAETGSGKTHGYLVPLIDKLCSIKTNVSENSLDNKRSRKNHQLSLVLCPNVMLCVQVVRMANAICDVNGEPLFRTAAICGRQGLSVREPEIIVSTPVALLNYLYAIDPEKHRRAEYIRGVKFVVFDEADLLLCGSFQNQVVRLINMLRFDEKQLSRMKNADSRTQECEFSSHEISDTKYDAMEIREYFMKEDEEDLDDDPVVEIESEVNIKRDWRRVRKIYDRRFVVNSTSLWQPHFL